MDGRLRRVPRLAIGAVIAAAQSPNIANVTDPSGIWKARLQLRSARAMAGMSQHCGSEPRVGTCFLAYYARDRRANRWQL
eukprot:7343218-Pyramimonas_sp.AAC.1